MNIIKPLIDTQPRPVSVDYNAPTPRISWQEEVQQFAFATMDAALEDGAARAAANVRANGDAVVQSIAAILNGQTETGSVSTVRRTAGDILPFKKSAPPAPRPRPPVQQPLRPAAELTPYGQQLRKMRLEDPTAFGPYLERKMTERRDAAQAERIQKLLRR